jgi:HNH endonuclease
MGKHMDFAAQALAADTDDCIVWPFTKDPRGYGWISVGSSNSKWVHRWVCEQAHGAPQGRMDAAHNCGNHSCINPRHLRWATRKDNEADKLLHGTQSRGERHGNHRLTEAEVKEIYALRGVVSGVEIAARYGVHKQTIYDIHTGRRWAWLCVA